MESECFSRLLSLEGSGPSRGRRMLRIPLRPAGPGRAVRSVQSVEARVGKTDNPCANFPEHRKQVACVASGRTSLTAVRGFQVSGSGFQRFVGFACSFRGVGFGVQRFRNTGRGRIDLISCWFKHIESDSADSSGKNSVRKVAIFTRSFRSSRTKEKT